jgi:hypothetical protein
MNRKQLATLRDILDLILELPDDAHAQIVAWLTPEAAKEIGNGVDRHPPPRIAPTSRSRPAMARQNKTVENKLLAAMQGNAGSSVSALAKAAGANRASTAERLRGLAARGVATKDSAGHWRLMAELAGEKPDPTLPSAAAS